MRIDPRNFGAESPAQKSGGTGQTGASAGVGSSSLSGSAATTSATNADSVRFSFDQARVQSLAEQALAAPEVRQQKVAALQQAIAGGTYSVDAGKVADAMVAEAAS